MYQSVDVQSVRTSFAADLPVSERPFVPYPLRVLVASTSRSYDYLIDLISEVVSLGSGWNGYDAVPISDSVAQNSAYLISELASLQFRLPAPAVSPEAMGTISMTWESQFGHAYLEVGESRYSGYIDPLAGEPIYSEGDARKSKFEFLSTIYERLFTSGQATPIIVYTMDSEGVTNTLWSLCSS